jgi:hypothetical protein
MLPGTQFPCTIRRFTGRREARRDRPRVSINGQISASRPTKLQIRAPRCCALLMAYRLQALATATARIDKHQVAPR